MIDWDHQLRSNRVGCDLARFVRDCPPDSHPVAVYVAAFQGPVIPTEATFEAALWEQLRGLHKLDHHGDDSQASEPHIVDEHDPGFVYCNREFFVVGLHPASSRWARRFAWPTLVFNALTHSEELKKSGNYERMQERILNRDHELQGSENPSLHCPQIAQFSGRHVDDSWQCPVEFE